MVERCRAVVVKHLFDPPAPHGLELIVAAVVGEGLEAGQLLSPRAKEGRSLGPLSALPQLLCSLISSQQPPSLVHLTGGGRESGGEIKNDKDNSFTS